ncbi:cell adhesion molecule 3 [Dicentrarchus labrax]|uniref:cell adhesion molecule 3 n=1 Tax=Dicentrarchus labrax TaxID=13489 RepID=UPI0021F68E93|nr:cell adhesion molecule 3 [Dicentrarchus labrax]
MWVFIFCGLIAFTGKAVSSSCPVKLSSPTSVVRYKDPFSANCSSSSDQVEGMGWESTNGGVPLSNESTFLALNIDSVTDWHLKPLCFINFYDGDQCAGTLPVTVYKMPDSVSMSPPSEMGPLVEGKKYRMQCDIFNVAPVRNLSVHWHKGNEIVYTETFDESTVTPVNKSSVLRRAAHADDNGTQIWCEATLKFFGVPDLDPIQSKSHGLIVLYSPIFSKPENETLEASADSQVTLNCTARGNPMPEYSWQFPHPIQRTDKKQIKNQPILTPSFQLTGTYSCTASNTQGTKTKYFTVNGAKRDRTTFAALVGVFTALGVLLFIGGLYFVTPEGTFSLLKGSYLRGKPTSGPV